MFGFRVCLFNILVCMQYPERTPFRVCGWLDDVFVAVCVAVCVVVSVCACEFRLYAAS